MKLRLFFAGLFGSGAILVAAKGDKIAPTAIMFWILTVLMLAAMMSALEQYDKDRK